MVIKNIRILDPESGFDEVQDLEIKDGKIASIGKIDKDGDIDGTNLILSPAFIDIHVHFRDPGLTYKEDIISGAKSAARGGYGSVVCMANTKPIIDNVETLKYFNEKAKEAIINVYTVSALSKGFKGEELVDMEEMVKNGAVGFTDDGIPNTNTSLIMEGMLRAKELDVPISFHEEDPELNKENGINHGAISEKLGIYGAPSISEDVFVARDGALSLETKAKIDIQHISSGRSVDLVRYYKSQGADLFAEVTPHHFSSTENLILEKGTLAKMNPPLRTEEDRDKIIKGLKDGTIEIIATDHAPHSIEEKEKPLLDAPSGIIGLETALGLGVTNLVKKGHLTLIELLEKLTINPARLYKLDCGEVKVGKVADLVIFDENEEYEVKDFDSKSSNSPYVGEKLYGKIKYTIIKGEIVYRD